MRIGKALVLLGVLAWFGGNTARGDGMQQEQPKGEIGILAGTGIHDKKLNPAREEGIGPLGGARVGYRLLPHLNWFADYTWSTFQPKNSKLPGRVDVSIGRTGLEYLFLSGERSPWNAFIAASGGVMDLLYYDDNSTFKPALASLGFGLRWSLNRQWALRGEVRADHTLSNMNDQLLTVTEKSQAMAAGESVNRVGADVIDYQDYLGFSLLIGGPAKDSDGDGVPDKADDCPNTPRGYAVDSHGCPLDSDGDGVPDGIDQCPNTPHGTPVNAVGCPLAVVMPPSAPPAPSQPAPAPIFQEGRKSLVLQGVTFRAGEAILSGASFMSLEKVAASLKSWPEVKVEIAGHTDSVGNPDANLKLSQARAQAVRDYLVRAGVEASRLTCKGYGSTRPVADNGTPQGRAENRRVEMTRVDQRGWRFDPVAGDPGGGCPPGFLLAPSGGHGPGAGRRIRGAVAPHRSEKRKTTTFHRERPSATPTIRGPIRETSSPRSAPADIPAARRG